MAPTPTARVHAPTHKKGRPPSSASRAGSDHAINVQTFDDVRVKQPKVQILEDD
jgi:hypothetical protein